MSARAAALTEEFYAWERRGRGWDLFDRRVPLEPPFSPFHRQSQVAPVHDDGRRPTIWESVWRWLTRSRSSVTEEAVGTEVTDPPDDDAPCEPLSELQVRLPPETDVSGVLAEELLLAIAAATARSSFELISAKGCLTLQIAVARRDAAAVQRVIQAYVPSAVVTTGPSLREQWERIEGEGVAIDFGLRQEFMLPLTTRRSLSIDPLLGVIAALEGVKHGEIGVVQVLLQQARVEWASSALRAITDGDGRAFFADAPETLSQAREKLCRPLLAAVIRAAARADDEERSWDLVRSLGHAVMAVYGAGANDLIALDDRHQDLDEHEQDVLDRTTHRSGMLLSSAELASLVHFPGAAVEAEDLRATASRTKAAPPVLQSGDVFLGTNAHRGREAPVYLRTADRLRHMHVVGATGTGKSTLLRSLIAQDLQAGVGLALLDPHGDLADEVLGLVPEHRLPEVVLFDPSDDEHPIGFNALDARSDRERELLASDLVGVFKRFSSSWGDQMTAVLGNAVMAFLESKEGGSLLDLRRFLMDREARSAILSTVDDPLVTSFWRDEFPRLGGRPQMPIVTRLDAFLRPKSIRNIVSQRQSRFDLATLMDAGGIFIGRLSQGAIGEQNAYLLGSLLVAKFQQVALARERQAERLRRPFFLYLDEFHNFSTPSIAALLSGARKYRLGLVLAHQDLRQLAEHDTRSAVLANAGTRICFRVGDEDARALSPGFRSFEASDLMSLGIGQAICRVGQADRDFNIEGKPPELVPAEEAARRLGAVREHSRARYGVSRAEVEALIAGPSPQADTAAAPMSVPIEPSSQPVRPVRAPLPQPPPRESPAASERRRPKPPLPGKGGPQHKNLQKLLKEYGEGRGFRATIEAPTPHGGAIDVLLERDQLRIACEISVTTDHEHEVGNVRKCLDAQATQVLLIASSSDGLEALEGRVRSSFSQEELARIRCVAPPDALGVLDQHAVSAPRENSVLGYKVKTTVSSGSDAGAPTRTVARTIMRAFRRLRGM